MATFADVKFAKALQASRQGIEEDQREITKQNRQASLWSGIGQVVGALVGGAVTGGNPLGVAVGARMFGEGGEQLAGGYQGGNIEEQLFFQEDTRRQNILFDEARGQMNTQQWMDAIISGITAGAGNVAQGQSFMGNIGSSPVGQLFQGEGETFFTGSQGGSPLATGQSPRIRELEQTIGNSFLGY